MAAQARLRATDSGGDRDGLEAATVHLCQCLLHDLVGAASFLATHPLHAAYLLFFARRIAALAAFFCPLLVSTALLLAALATVGPYLGGAYEWPGGVSYLGRTCVVAVDALRAELQPDGGGAGLVAQLCSFVLDAVAVDRDGEIVGELCCDITGSCFFLSEEAGEGSLLQLLGEEECKEQAFEAPLINDAVDVRSFLDHEGSGEGKDRIDDKIVISEDLTCSESSAEQCFQSKASSVQEMDHVSDVIVEKRLECDPVSVEIKKCEPVQAVEIHPVAPKATKTREPGSSISQRIKLWEAQVSGNFKTVIAEDISVKFSMGSKSIKDVKKCVPLEGDPRVDETCDLKLKTQDITSNKQSEEQEHDQEFKDVKECVHSETEPFIEICSRNSKAKENASASHTEQIPNGVHPEAELQEQECRAAQNRQECQFAQPEQDIQEVEEYKDLTESPVMCNERESSLKSTSIAGRVHSRTSSENLVSDGSPSQREKEWKRTLACKLYEERMQLKLCRDRAVIESSDNMDMLWEAYEVGGSGSGVKQGSIKVKRSKRVEEMVEEDESEEQDDGEGSVRQLCCLQALKFSTKKMRFGGGKPSLAKISKVLERMTVLSRVGSRRSQKG